MKNPLIKLGHISETYMYLGKLEVNISYFRENGSCVTFHGIVACRYVAMGYKDAAIYTF